MRDWRPSWAPLVGADVEKAKTAALLCKTDFLPKSSANSPKSGHDGKYYALAQGEDASVAGAIEEHYKPRGRTTAYRPIRYLIAGPRRQDRHGWSGFGPSTKSRREQGPVLRCAGRR